jgi:hypothetical protein
MSNKFTNIYSVNETNIGNVQVFKDNKSIGFFNEVYEKHKYSIFMFVGLFLLFVIF